METKYNCEKCQFKCGYLSIWTEHLASKIVINVILVVLLKYY